MVGSLLELGQPIDLVKLRSQLLRLLSELRKLPQSGDIDPLPDALSGRKRSGPDREIVGALEDIRVRLDVVSIRLGLPNQDEALSAALQDVFTLARSSGIKREALQKAVELELGIAYHEEPPGKLK